MESDFKNSSNKSGTYCIVNKTNGKTYYGSAKRFKQRFYEHNRTLIRGTHKNRHLQGAWNLDGTDTFMFEVLEVIEGKENYLASEQVLLDMFWDGCVNCYNVEKTARSNRGSRSSPKHKLTLEHKQKIGLSHKGKIVLFETRNKLSQSQKGNHNSFTTEFGKGHVPWNKGKIGLMSPRKGVKLSQETKERIRSSLKKQYSQKTSDKVF